MAMPFASPPTRANDLALLRLYGARGLVPMPFAQDAAAANGLTLLGIADPLGEGSDNEVTGSIAQRTDQGLNPAPKLGYSGAAAIDAQGRFAGMVAMKAPVDRRRARGAARRRWCRPQRCGLFCKAKASPSAPAMKHRQSVPPRNLLRVICVRR